MLLPLKLTANTQVSWVDAKDNLGLHREHTRVIVGFFL